MVKKKMLSYLMQALSYVVFLGDYHVHGLESKILPSLVLESVRDVVWSIISLRAVKLV